MKRNPKRPSPAHLGAKIVLFAAGEPRDGYLGLQEIQGLELKADPVVLSACRTALGEQIRGEGIVGLSRGFLDAGARSVVVSLWDVDDDATAELMERFYRHLLRGGLPPAAALRAAQISMWREARWRAASHWGAFLVQGGGTAGVLR